jgi:hypothetical protein
VLISDLMFSTAAAAVVGLLAATAIVSVWFAAPLVRRRRSELPPSERV